MEFPGQFRIMSGDRTFVCVPCVTSTYFGNPTSGFAIWELVDGRSVLLGRRFGGPADAIDFINSLSDPFTIFCLTCEY